MIVCNDSHPMHTHTHISWHTTHVVESHITVFGCGWQQQQQPQRSHSHKYEVDRYFFDMMKKSWALKVLTSRYLMEFLLFDVIDIILHFGRAKGIQSDRALFAFK